MIRKALLILLLSVSVAGAQSSPKAAMLEQDAWAALDAGKAQASFQQALVLDPQQVRARAQLAQIMRREGDLAGAIREYKIVVGESAGNAGAEDTLDRWKREFDLHERMRLAVGDHFTVSFEGPEDARLAEEALASLDRAFWRVCDVFGAFPVSSIKVVLYSHEFVHALVRTMATTGVPTWLNEGLASALESDSMAWAETRLQKASAMPTLKDLQSTFGKLDGAQAQVAYSFSAIAAKRLLDEAGGTAVANLLRDLGEGVPFDDAFLHRIQRSFADFQSTLAQR